MTDTAQIIEEAIGQSIDLIDWRKRMKEGVVVDLKIKYWKARKKLSLEELGIDPPNAEMRQVYEELLSIGTKLLLPEATLKELSAIERSARLNLQNNAYLTPFGYFVPYSTYPLWKTRNEEYKRLFLAKRDEIIKGQDQYGNLEDTNGRPIKSYYQRVEELLTKYEQLARHSYQLMKAQDANNLSSFANENDYAQHFCSEVISRYIKSAQEFSDSFKYTESLTRMPLLSNLDTEETTDEEVTEVMTTKQAEMKAAQDRVRLLDEMNRDLIKNVQEQKKALIDSFLTSLVKQLRSTTYDAVSSVLASIKEQETLQGRPAIQLKHLITQIENLNFYGDADIDQILTTLHGIIEKPAKERDIAEITRQLRSIATITRGTILALGEMPRQGKEQASPQEIGISPLPSDEEVREARLELAEVASTIRTQDSQREEREERQEVLPTSLTVESQRTERSD